MLNADIRIPRGIDNLVAIDLLMAHIQRQLEQNSITHMNHILSLSTTQDSPSPYQNFTKESDCDVCTKNPKKFSSFSRLPNLVILSNTPQINALNTFILACGSEINSKDSFIHTNFINPPTKSKKIVVSPKTTSNDPYGPLKKFFSTTSAHKSHFDRADFVFHFDRIATRLIDRALDEFSYGPGPALYGDSNTKVFTPGGFVFDNATRMVSQPAAVELLRGGECFDTALRKTIRDIPLGKILIQSNSKTGEPQLHSLSLPPCVDPRICSDQTDLESDDFKLDGDDEVMSRGSEYSQDSQTTKSSIVELNNDDLELQRKTKILLCDSQLSSGAAVTMSVAILLDHGIKEENIVIVAYMATNVSIQRLYTAYPKVKVVVGILTHAAVPRFVDNVYFGTV